MNERIIVKCQHKNYSLIRAWALPTVLIVQRGEWGKIASIREFNVFETERINFADHPEIEGVYDNDTQAWDVGKLYALLHDCCEEMTNGDAE